MRRLLPLLFTLAACGDPLALGDYEGVPIASFQGSVLRGPGSAYVPSAPHVGLIYPDLAGFGVFGYQGISVPVRSTSFPASFEFRLYEEPAARSVGTYFSMRGNRARMTAKISLGLVWAFDDLDGNGIFVETDDGSIAGDRLIGVATRDFLLHVSAAPETPEDLELLRGIAFDNPEALVPGYVHVRCSPPTDPESGLGRLRVADPGEPIEVVLADESQLDDEFDLCTFWWPSQPQLPCPYDPAEVCPAIPCNEAEPFSLCHALPCPEGGSRDLCLAEVCGPNFDRLCLVE